MHTTESKKFNNTEEISTSSRRISRLRRPFLLKLPKPSLRPLLVLRKKPTQERRDNSRLPSRRLKVRKKKLLPELSPIPLLSLIWRNNSRLESKKWLSNNRLKNWKFN
jgi:hypothetical protein